MTVITLGAIATTAAARTRPEPRLATGDGFDLKPRQATLPRGDSTAPPRAVVTDRQVDDKIRDRFDELEYCWLRVPSGHRVAASATLHLAIDVDGTVAAARVVGELPAGVDRCITTAASRWRFPVTGSKCELEHAFTMSIK